MSLPSFALDVHVPPHKSPPAWMIGPRSLFADRMVPEVEFILVPARHHPAMKGRFEAQAGPRTTRDFRARKDKLLPWRGSTHGSLPEGRYLFDARERQLPNWSHSLNQALVLALKARDLCEEHGAPDPVVVLPTFALGKVKTLFQRLGFDLIVTDEALTAPLITYREDAKTVIRHFNRAWSEPHLAQIAELTKSDGAPLGRSLFISRRGGRVIDNVDIIQPLLEARGFTTVYPEEHTLEEQFQMIRQAEKIVAIHGAGLAPLLFRPREAGPLLFVEIFSASHVTPFFRQMAAHLPCEYRAVRGVPGRGTVPAAYDPETAVTDFAKAHSLEPFVVDPLSLEVALGPDPIGKTLAGERPEGLD